MPTLSEVIASVGLGFSLALITEYVMTLYKGFFYRLALVGALTVPVTICIRVITDTRMTPSGLLIIFFSYLIGVGIINSFEGYRF